MGHDADFACHFAASTLAAVINFPLWRASAIAQSGFKLEGSNFIIRYYHAAVKPPFKGLAATIAGMAWARGAIFCKLQLLQVLSSCVIDSILSDHFKRPFASVITMTIF
jgi:hypothetical protein